MANNLDSQFALPTSMTGRRRSHWNPEIQERYGWGYLGLALAKFRACYDYLYDQLYWSAYEEADRYLRQILRLPTETSRHSRFAPFVYDDLDRRPLRSLCTYLFNVRHPQLAEQAILAVCDKLTLECPDRTFFTKEAGFYEGYSGPYKQLYVDLWVELEKDLMTDLVQFLIEDLKTAVEEEQQRELDLELRDKHLPY